MNDKPAPALSIHLQGVGRVPAVLAQELKPGDQLMYNYGSVYQIVKIEDASACFVRIFEVSTDTGEEFQRRVKKTSTMALVPQEYRRRLGHDAPASHYRPQVKPPTGDLGWITVSHGATIEDAMNGLTASGKEFAYFGSVILGRHKLGGHYDTTKASIEAMIGGQTLTAPDGHRFRILPPVPDTEDERGVQIPVALSRAQWRGARDIAKRRAASTSQKDFPSLVSDLVSLRILLDEELTGSGADPLTLTLSLRSACALGVLYGWDEDARQKVLSRTKQVVNSAQRH